MNGWLVRRAAVGIAVLLPSRAQEAARVTLTPAAVAFGEPFALEVVRRWPASHVPEPFADAALLPFAVDLQSARVVAAGGDFVETRRYRAIAYCLGLVRLPDLVVRSQAPDGSVMAASTVPPVLTVTSCLPEPPGPVEWPGDVRDARRQRDAVALWLVALVAVALAASGMWFWWRRARPPSVPDAHALREALLALPLPAAGDRAATAAYYHELARLVRAEAAAWLRQAVEARTTEELVASAAAVRDQLVAGLTPCDLVKFAAAQPVAIDHAAAKTAALAFVAAAAAEPRP